MLLHSRVIWTGDKKVTGFGLRPGSVLFMLLIHLRGEAVSSLLHSYILNGFSFTAFAQLIGYQEKHLTSETSSSSFLQFSSGGRIPTG